ncbi:MAG: HEPN domain-containing protein [Candidatus Methanodesulfokora sp.]|jgi:HEPN domain-containing protein
MDFLRRNAMKFLEEAHESFKKGDYAFTMLFVEQAVQLALKYFLARKFGEFPKSHSLKLLFELADDERLTEFYRNEIDLIRDIELSHVAARYMDVEYTEEAARRALDLAERLIKVIQ